MPIPSTTRALNHRGQPEHVTGRTSRAGGQSLFPSSLFHFFTRSAVLSTAHCSLSTCDLAHGERKFPQKHHLTPCNHSTCPFYFLQYCPLSDTFRCFPPQPGPLRRPQKKGTVATKEA
jgi:hypothetical protein